MTKIPASVDEVTPKWLSEVLETDVPTTQAIVDLDVLGLLHQRLGDTRQERA